MTPDAPARLAAAWVAVALAVSVAAGVIASVAPSNQYLLVWVTIVSIVLAIASERLS